MTNEKAIDLLRRMQEPEAYEPQITEEAFEALELAIRALGADTNVEDTHVLVPDPDELTAIVSCIGMENLAEFRDALLHDLMSGKIDISGNLTREVTE